jgi:glucose-6-phosphate isomerase
MRAVSDDIVQAALVGDLEAAVDERVRQATDDRVAARVWDHDPTLWKGTADTPELADRLGWLTIADRQEAERDELEAWAAEVRGRGLTDAVLLGMGGSSLGPEVIRRSFGLALHVLDSTDPEAIRAVGEAVDPTKTMFVVSSKSGGTVETRSHLEHFWALTDGAGGQFAAVTDPGSPLDELAAERGCDRVFHGDPEIGGRYSVLSPFGLVPAALAGAPVAELLRGAIEAASRSHAETGNRGLWLGLALGELARHGRDKLTFVVSPPIDSFGLWAEQLVAESTGKQGRGILPVADEPLGPPDVYGTDRVFLHVRGNETHDESLAALAAAGHPVITVPAEGPADLGRLFFGAEFATAVAGAVLEINPFDQPNVQQAKDATNAALESGETEVEPGTSEDLLALLDATSPPGYVSLHGYLAPSSAVDDAVAVLREAIRRRTKATTTFGYGPRFLHSTGQLHKGGPPVGAFVQFMHDAGDDVEIPGKPYTFRTLKHAQAAGDLKTLREHGRPVVRLALDGDPAAALRDLTAIVERTTA